MHGRDHRSTRRSFLGKSALSGACLLGLSPRFTGLLGASALRADEVDAKPESVRFSPEIEPLVRLLEDTPRDRLIEVVGARVQKGLSYRELLAALFLAGIRNVEPRPSVGFKFHAVLVVNSAHLASLASPDADRWLPIFWALDSFKSAQARDEVERGWTMPAVDSSKLPKPGREREAFIDAMDAWDEEAADGAASALASRRGAGTAFELLWRYGARDFRSIGHKAIYVANSFRTLQAIGVEHAEPIVRSLAYALLNHEGEANPAKSEHRADAPFRRHVELLKSLPENWTSGRLDDGATKALLATLRTGSDEDASRHVVDLLEEGIDPRSVWDAFFVASAELVTRQPGIVPLHAVTTTNALHFAYLSAASDETRRLAMLQNAAFLALFRESAAGRGELPEQPIDRLEPAELEEKPNVAGIFERLGGDRHAASRELLTYLGAGGDADEVLDAARVLVFLKGDDAHDYKFSSACLEDYRHVSPSWRDRYLAGTLHLLRHSKLKDRELVARTRAALA